MNITLIGGGIIGRTLGVAWAKAGHTARFGARDAASPKVVDALAAVRAIDPAASALPIGDAIALADVVVLATPGRAVEGILVEQGARLAAKIVVDAANTVGGGPMHHMAAFATHAPEALAFRAFNSLGWEVFAQPVIGGIQADLFYCGPDGAAQRSVETLITDVGLRPVRIGGVDQADTLDAMTGLWFTLALRQSRGRHLAFKLLG